MSKVYKALIVRKDGGSFNRSIEERNISELPKDEVLIRVHFSSLNYKDGLSCSGVRTVTRHYPHTPGVDAAGVIESSSDNKFKVGDHVVVISFDLGMNTSGGFGQYISVPADWVMPLPEGLSLRESMIYGTAGFTAGISIYLLQKQNIFPDSGPILVTGASGGVGSLSVALLSSLGYSVSASTGKRSAEEFLNMLGASEVIDRKSVDDDSGRPLLKEVWAGAIDSLGGNTLVTILKSTKMNGVVLSVGLVSSPKLDTTVFPFIMRGIILQGVAASDYSMSVKKEVWSRLASIWKLKNLEHVVTDCSLEDLNSKIDKILTGDIQGRVVVDMRS
jgi:acrylyl-CoA reductase (NADPH)